MSACAWLLDGEHFISAAHDKMILLWNRRGEAVQSWMAGRVTELAVSREGIVAVCAQRIRMLKLGVDPADGRPRILVEEEQETHTHTHTKLTPLFSVSVSTSTRGRRARKTSCISLLECVCVCVCVCVHMYTHVYMSTHATAPLFVCVVTLSLSKRLSCSSVGVGPLTLFSLGRLGASAARSLSDDVQKA